MATMMEARQPDDSSSHDHEVHLTSGRSGNTETFIVAGLRTDTPNSHSNSSSSRSILALKDARDMATFAVCCHALVDTPNLNKKSSSDNRVPLEVDSSSTKGKNRKGHDRSSKLGDHTTTSNPPQQHAGCVVPVLVLSASNGSTEICIDDTTSSLFDFSDYDGSGDDAFSKTSSSNKSSSLASSHTSLASSSSTTSSKRQQPMTEETILKQVRIRRRHHGRHRGRRGRSHQLF